MSERPRLLVWAERGQADLVRAAALRAAVEIVAVGAAGAAAATELADALAAERVADFRQAVQRDDVDAIWILAAERIGADERRLLRGLGRPVISAEPRPMRLGELLRDAEEARTARFAPLFRATGAFRAAEEALREFGAVRLLALESGGPAEAGTLFARLFDAMDVVNALGGGVEDLHAALAGPRDAVPEALDALHGHAAVSLRGSARFAATIAASDRAGTWHRRATVVGEGGAIEITDVGYHWRDPSGAPVESWTDEEGARGPGALVGAQLDAMLRRGDALPLPDVAAVLALCEAARLSARTGQAESPNRVAEMFAGV